MNRIVLFDGECHFCDSSVHFIIKHDTRELFHFAPLKSAVSKELLLKYDVSPEINSIVLIENEKAYVKSTAALRICRQLRGTVSSHPRWPRGLALYPIVRADPRDSTHPCTAVLAGIPDLAGEEIQRNLEATEHR